MSNVLEKMAGAHRQHALKVKADYDAFVHDTEAGKDIDPCAGLEILSRAGKSHDDLVRAVENVRLRRGQATLYAKLEPAKRALADIEAKLAGCDEKLARAKEEHARTVEPLKANRDRIASEVIAAENAGGELFRTCTDPDIQAAQDAISLQVKKLTALRRETDHEYFSAKREGSPGWDAIRRAQEIQRLESEGADDKPKMPEQLRKLKQSAAELEKATIAPARAKLADIDKQLAELNRAQTANDAKKYLP